MTTNAIYEARFWSRVAKTETCWLWIGTTTYNGYGNFYGFIDDQRFWRAHRYSWALENGEIPPGLDICHHCDVRLCVRPEHLFLGTRKQNLRDAVRKGRLSGERNANVKLTEADVLAIRASTASHSELGRQYDIHASHIGRIRSGEKWSHIPLLDR